MTIAIELRGREAAQARLPDLFAGASRSADPGFDAFIPPGYLTPRRTLDLSPAARGSEDGAVARRHDSGADEVLVLELADGGTLVTSAARLRDSLLQSHPDLVGADGTLRLEALRLPGEAMRGDTGAALALISKVFGFGVGAQPDAILLEAAREFGIGQALLGVSWLGTKALMWAIEKRLPRGPGLYAWNGGELGERPLPALDARVAEDPARHPILVFLHGTGSSTAGSFGDLRQSGREWWAALEQRYPGGIYGFEHCTLSESPIDNALALLAALPAGARLSLVSHSRGGLVGDLLCVGDIEAAIDAYRHDLPGTGDADPREAQRVLHELEDAHAEQRGKLQQLVQALRDKQPVVQRYVRVAAPAAGTRLASGNLDLFLSGLLSLIGKAPGLFGSPYYAAFKRVVLEIAKNRTNARLVPGIEAMLPDAPLARLLRDAPVREGLAMAVVAGDIEGGEALLRRLGVLLVDFLFFDQVDNDLVVDTPAMLAGIAPHAAARVRFDRGSDVSHFRYFENADTRDALNDWLLAEDLAGVDAFRALPGPQAYAQALAEAAATRDVGAEERPMVVVLPGCMGTHLGVGPTAAQAERVWFEPPDLARGRLERIAWGQRDVVAQALFGTLYGPLCRHLAASHRVEALAYDWRQPLDVLADQLADVLRACLAVSAQPVRLLAHGMGGLLVRACIHRHRALMDELMARPGARLVMLGTPNQGAYSMVANLLGKGGTLRALARLDRKHDLQQVLDIVAGFRGALQLLPKPGFRDQFQGQEDGGADGWAFQRADTWAALAAKTQDAWFGDGRVGRPSQDVLDAASWLWQQDGAAPPALPAAYGANSVYVFGVGANTPCGLRELGGRLKLVGTPHGDGTVSWASGRIEGIGQYYYLPAEHGDLPSTEEFFPALVELLGTGRSTRLATTPPAVRAIEQPAPVSFDAGPPVLEDDDTLLRRIVGAAPRRAAGSTRRAPRRLEVAVRAMDLRFVTQPILVGQYDQDPIAGPQALIDRELLGGALGERHRLGMYPGPLGSATAVLRVSHAGPGRAESVDGAIVTGLGSYDRPLTLAYLTEAVRAGALRYLLQTLDMLGSDERALPLAALLLGYNSSANLSIEASVEALVRGVMEANARFRETSGAPIRIQRLDIVELYADTAISAAYALRALAPRLQPDAARLGTQLACSVELVQHASSCQRLYDGGGGAYWPRLIVTDAGRPEGEDLPAQPSGQTLLPGLARRTLLADRLRFVYVGRRARAETLVQQRQPGLVEKLVRSQIQNKVWQEDFGRMLFQLMVPHDFKDAARQLDRVVLVVDSCTANLPWELMLADEPGRAEAERAPLAMRTALVRQLSSSSYRRQVRQGIGDHALVVGNPSLEGFVEAFPGPNGQPRPEPEPLHAAEEEATAVQGVLGRLGFQVKAVIGADQPAANVFAALYQQAWRLVHISAHGVFDLRHADGRDRSGVLLSDGMLITAAEFEAMEVVPELVFLNCCHLGKLDSTPLRDGNKLAASVARELIEIGVRCVVVAGWAVSDKGARLFGETFYRGLIGAGLAFGDALHQARLRLWEADPNDITWGAFQAYGDPGWRVGAEQDSVSAAGDDVDRHFVSPDELLDALARLRSDVARREREMKQRDRRARIAQVHALLRERARPGWQALPAVQAALGATWRDLGEFALAREAYLAAVRADDRSGRVSIRDMEQLANVEARLGEMVGDAGLISQALVRLDALDHLTGGGPGGSLAAARRTAERSALIGSAHKRFAGVQARALLGPAPPTAAALAELHQALAASRQAYAEAGEAGDDPYLLLNRLALDALLLPEREPKARRSAVELARRCGVMAAERFAQSGSVWDALMQPEALLVEQMLEGRLSLADDSGDSALAALQLAYAAALGRVVIRPAEIDSSLGQLELLSRFADALSLGDAVAAAAARRTLASRLLALVQFIQPGRARRDDRPALPAQPPAAPKPARRRRPSAG